MASIWLCMAWDTYLSYLEESIDAIPASAKTESLTVRVYSWKESLVFDITLLGKS